MKKKKSKLNKFYKFLKIIFAFQLVAYIFLVFFSVSIASDRNSLKKQISAEETELFSYEKNFFNQKQALASDNYQNSIVDTIEKRQKFVEYIYTNVEKVANR